MNRIAPVFVVVLAAAAARGDEIFQDFRGKDVDAQMFRFHGPDAAARIHPEAKGLRITLPANPKASTIGIATRSRITGNFELTVGYELLVAERPMKGSGLGLEIYVNTNTEAQDAVIFYHIVKPKEGEVYMCDKKATINGERKTTRRTFPAQTKTGRLRLARQGKEVVYSMVEGAGADFKELCRYDWIDVDATIAVRAWGAENPVELLVTDLRIRDNLPPAPAAKTEPRPIVAPAPTSRVWLWLIGAICAMLILAGALVTALLLTRRKHDAADRPAFVSFHCTHCGKHLKTDAAAGKTVKCVACGQSVAIPERT
jgi:ribosomal protein S27E